MKRHNIELTTLTLSPTEQQATLLMDARETLQAAREAVCREQRKFYQVTGDFFAPSDIVTTDPKLVIVEAVAASSGVIDVSMVRNYLSAGCREGRGKLAKPESELNCIRYPEFKVDSVGDSSVLIHNIGWIATGDYQPNGIPAKELTMMLHYPENGNGTWTATLYTNNSKNVRQLHAAKAEREEKQAAIRAAITETKLSADMKSAFSTTMMQAANTLKSNAELTDCQNAALDMLKEAFGDTCVLIDFLEDWDDDIIAD